MKCVIGLGNPGRRYASTRHNIGFMVLDRISQKLNLGFSEKGFSSVALGTIADSSNESRPVKVLLAKPGTYMNRSGIAVAEILTDFPILSTDMLVVHDDLDIPFGRLRFKRKGSSGGHRGIQSIIDFIGTCDFSRLKVGIGRPDSDIDPAEYVLTSFEDGDLLSSVIDVAANAALYSLASGLGQAMNQYNRNLTVEEYENT